MWSLKTSYPITTNCKNVVSPSHLLGDGVALDNTLVFQDLYHNPFYKLILYRFLSKEMNTCICHLLHLSKK